jgi:hypothetical protein
MPDHPRLARQDRPMQKRRAILHIGTEKTGTTAIQGVLARSRAALLERGFAYPKSTGQGNHVQLAFYAAEGRIARIAHLYERGGVSSACVVETYPAELEAEVAALPGSVHTLLFSTEHCHSRLHDEGVGRLKALLDRFCDDYRTVVYLRRQDELRGAVAPVFQHHPHRPLPDLRRKPVRRLLRHNPILSTVGASDKPGAVYSPRLQTAGAGGGAAGLRRLARGPTPTGPASGTSRGAQADAELTFEADHPMGADQARLRKAASRRLDAHFLMFLDTQRRASTCLHLSPRGNDAPSFISARPRPARPRSKSISP